MEQISRYENEVQCARMEQHATQHVQKAGKLFMTLHRRRDPHVDRHDRKDRKGPEVVHAKIKSGFFHPAFSLLRRKTSFAVYPRVRASVNGIEALPRTAGRKGTSPPGVHPVFGMMVPWRPRPTERRASASGAAGGTFPPGPLCAMLDARAAFRFPRTRSRHENIVRVVPHPAACPAQARVSAGPVVALAYRLVSRLEEVSEGTA